MDDGSLIKLCDAVLLSIGETQSGIGEYPTEFKRRLLKGFSVNVAKRTFAIYNEINAKKEQDDIYKTGTTPGAGAGSGSNSHTKTLSWIKSYLYCVKMSNGRYFVSNKCTWLTLPNFLGLSDDNISIAVQGFAADYSTFTGYLSFKTTYLNGTTTHATKNYSRNSADFHSINSGLGSGVCIKLSTSGYGYYNQNMVAFISCYYNNSVIQPNGSFNIFGTYSNKKVTPDVSVSFSFPLGITFSPSSSYRQCNNELMMTLS